jgi:uncharacterized protein YodC (DUF2158 family)
MAETTEIAVGHVVKLRSGGPLMTVVKLAGDGEHATCSWFSDVQTLETAQFSIAAIRSN